MSWIRLIKEGRKLITLNKLPFDAVKQNKKLFNVNNNRYFSRSARSFSSSATTESLHHNDETVKKYEFKAETRMLLDIVAKSLYSEKEVFLRELISNASDALEKFRYTTHSNIDNANIQDINRKLEIDIKTDKPNNKLIIQDTGIGFTKDELITNLGTIAKSGSKQFLKELAENDTSSGNTKNIIGQFGVGFYSAFMVANKVEVFTRSYLEDSKGLRWSSDGSGVFEVEEIDDIPLGTKVILHLKPESREYSDEDNIKNVILKYSNFVGHPINLNGKQVNEIQPVWLMEPKEVKIEQHNEFYRFVGNTFDKPRFILHYKTDVPLSIRALLYFPEGKPGLFEMSRDRDIGVALYTHKILIQSKTEHMLPKWLRFVKGVVDSEDIPLNLSRELLQNSALITKLRNVLTNRVLRFLHDKSVKETAEFEKFYKDYGIFLKEGIITSDNYNTKEEIAKLLRFDSNLSVNNQSVSLPEYCSRLKEGQNDVYYLAAPNRTLAENSPYYEDLKKKNFEVLFCYEPYDELVLMQLQSFLGHKLISVEKEMRMDKSSESLTDLSVDSLTQSDINHLIDFVKKSLQSKIAKVKITNKLDSHPCVITVEDMAAARHFIRTQSHNLDEENRFALLQPHFEINPKNSIIKKVCTLSKTNEELANLITKQLFANAMVNAGLADDPRELLTGMNDLLSKLLEKY